MEMPMAKYWMEKNRAIEEERDMWKNVARRLSIPVHDPNCEYGAPCSYCDAMSKASQLG